MHVWSFEGNIGMESEIEAIQNNSENSLKVY